MQVNHKATTRVQKAFKLEHVPVEKVSTMVQRTTLGGLFIVLGVLGAAKWEWEWYVVAGMCLFGGSFWSTQLVTQTLMALLTPAKAIKALIGKDDV
jgi:uncharacterized membrane protein YgdD (TMEM256/DUF423 family)